MRCALFGGPLLEPVQYALFKERGDQREDAAVRYLVPDTGKKTIFGDRVEIALPFAMASGCPYQRDFALAHTALTNAAAR
jgi:hypothetical protein